MYHVITVDHTREDAVRIVVCCEEQAQQAFKFARVLGEDVAYHSTEVQPLRSDEERHIAMDIIQDWCSRGLVIR
jgi:hypothetical protein